MSDYGSTFVRPLTGKTISFGSFANVLANIMGKTNKPDVLVSIRHYVETYDDPNFLGQSWTPGKCLNVRSDRSRSME